MFQGRKRVGALRLVGLGLLLVALSAFTAASLEQLQVGVYVNSSEVVVYWDPSETFSNEVIIMNNVYETLLRYDPFKDKFEPVLAESYERSADGLTWTFHLRKGVKFHTGGEMDAEAVKFSIERTIERGMGASYIWAPVDRIEVADKYTVVFHLKWPAPLDLIAAAAYAAHIFDPDFSDHEWFLQCHDSGTGPYMVESCTGAGAETVVLTRFNDYWRGWEGKHFDKVVFRWVEEPSTRRMMLEAGEADFTNLLPITEIEALRGKPGMEIIHTPSFQNLLALFNTAKTAEFPISNKLVRKALAYTIPYKDVVEGVLGGYGRQSRGVVPYGLWGYSEKVKQYTLSIETARALLAAAGYPDGGFKLLLTYVSGDENERRTAELWKSELAKLNVTLEIRGMPWEAQVDLGHATDPNERQDIFLFYWWPDYAHPHSFLSAMFETLEPPLFNFSYYSNPVYDALINRANELSATNREEAINMYVEAQNILMEDAAGVAIYDMEYLRAKRASLKGYVDNPVYSHVVFWYDCYRE
jgi:peptide/nickel transport system substrate-binding protein